MTAPRLTGGVQADGLTIRQLRFLIADARRAQAAPVAEPQIAFTRTERMPGSLAPARALTARAGQTVLFLLTILLSGMLLSQLIDEKANKIIEVLAAAVPIDAIFLGKLFAMLAMSLLGIAVWTARRRRDDRADDRAKPRRRCRRPPSAGRPSWRSASSIS